MFKSRFKEGRIFFYEQDDIFNSSNMLMQVVSKKRRVEYNNIAQLSFLININDYYE